VRGDLRGGQGEHPLAVGLSEHSVGDTEFGQSSLVPDQFPGRGREGDVVPGREGLLRHQRHD